MSPATAAPSRYTDPLSVGRLTLPSVPGTGDFKKKNQESRSLEPFVLSYIPSVNIIPDTYKLPWISQHTHPPLLRAYTRTHTHATISIHAHTLHTRDPPSLRLQQRQPNNNLNTTHIHTHIHTYRQNAHLPHPNHQTQNLTLRLLLPRHHTRPIPHLAPSLISLVVIRATKRPQASLRQHDGRRCHGGRAAAGARADRLVYDASWGRRQ